MPAPPIRLALFLCDTPIPEVKATDGDYSDIFNVLLKSAPLSSEFILDAYAIREKMEYPEDIDKYQGIIITGSAASAYENLDWINMLVAYIASVAAEKPHIKLIGICFGHQIISRALGEECVPNNGIWEAGPTSLNLTDAGKQLFGTTSLNIQEMHRDHVPVIPKDCILLGSSPISHNQGYIRLASPAQTPADFTDPQVVKSIQIFTVQGHPEFTARIIDSIIKARLFSGVIPPDVAAQARDRRDWRNDGVDVIGKAIWKILGA